MKQPRTRHKKRLFLWIGFILLFAVVLITVKIVSIPEIRLTRSEAKQTHTPISESGSAPEDLLVKAFQKEEQTEEAVLEQTISENTVDTKEVLPLDIEPEAAIRTKLEDEPPIRLTDLTFFEKEKIIMQCYEPGAQSYDWEVYSELDKQWMEATKKSGIKIELLQDQSGREISTLTIQEDPINTLKIRCIVHFAEEEKELISEAVVSPFSYQEMGDIKAITIPDFKANSGDILSSLELPVVIENEDGKKIELKGIQTLVFCLEQEEENSRVFDEESSLTTDTYTKTYYETRFYPVKSGEEKVQLRCRIRDEEFELEASVTGEDQLAPDIQELQGDYMVTNVDHKVPVTISATVTDNVDAITELVFAFAHEKVPEEKLTWSKELPLREEVSMNGFYYFYAKDTAGNISKEKVEIITVDMKAPVIDEAKLQRADDFYTVNVIARDKTKLEYCLYQAAGHDQNQIWQEDSSFTIAQNGEYILKVRDAAGNETINAETIRIIDLDATAPVIVGIEEISGTKESEE